MINAIVVDDEKLVRKGFISLVDWPSYGIAIVGEAADSQQALRLLQEQPAIDLMFVDITMPGMTGFELIKRVQQKHASVQSVILTCHHEFDYIQEALRLGVIDYIVKTLLGKDNVDETMRRITGRLRQESARMPLKRAGFGGAIAAYGMDDSCSPGHIRDALPEGAVWVQLAPWLHLYTPGSSTPDWNAAELQHRLARGWTIAEVAASDRHTAKEAETLIAERLAHALFYAPPASPRRITLQELEALRKAAGDTDELNRLQAEWEQLRWLLYGKEWHTWRERVAAVRPEPALLLEWMNELRSDWSMCMAWSPEERAALAAEHPARSWKEAEQALSALALVVQRRMADLSLSREVALSLFRALQMMKLRACENLTQDEVARNVNMSRSYFSQCFKLFIGDSFGEVLRRARIEHAKRLLRDSGMTVSDISGAVGFSDNKHFSRTFKERVGVYPTQYREMHDAITVTEP